MILKSYMLGLSLIIGLYFFSCSSKSQTSQDESTSGKESLDYNISLETLEGEKISMSSFKDKVIFLNIWATWCPPCRKEMPSIEALKNRLVQQDVQFILVSPENPDVISEYLRTNKLNLPVYRITKTLPAVLHDEYIPRTYIVDRFGQIVHKYVGEKDWNNDEIFGFLNFLSSAKIK